MQPKKHPEDYSEHATDSEDGQLAPEAPEALDYASGIPEVLEVPGRRLQKHSMPTGLDHEDLGGLSDLGQQDCSQVWNILE